MLEKRPRFGLIMLAAGLSRRMGGPNKLLQLYRGKPLLAHALRGGEDMEFFDRVAVEKILFRHGDDFPLPEKVGH